MRSGHMLLGALLLCPPISVNAAEVPPFDPAAVDLADVLACKIDGGRHMGFAITISDDDSPSSAKARGWVKMPTKSLFFSSYRLPKPLSVFGHTTGTVAFTGSAMLAVLDLPDATALGAEQGVANVLTGSGQFKGERVVDETTTVDKATGYGFKNHSALQIATNPAFPGKVLIGCSYDGEMLGPGQ